VDDATGIQARLLAGDGDALGEVVRWIAQVIVSRRFLAVRHEWVDLHQEALTRVIESLRQGRFDPGQDFRSYVQAIARYTTLQSLNRPDRRSARQPISVSLTDPAPGAEDLLSLRELARRALARASDECRQLLRAYFIEERDYAEIASEAGVPLGTVKSRLMSCLESAHRVLTGRRTGRFPKAPSPVEGDA
jgi:RNA polymerase sigma-70 factor (ECF subfamily)